MDKNNVLFVDSKVLAVVDNELPNLLKKTGCQCIMLVERSGIVLSVAGDPPLHPNEIGVTAAGLYAAMNLMIKMTQAEAFTIVVPADTVMWLFQYVSEHIFLLAHHPKHTDGVAKSVHAMLAKLAEKARLSLSEKSNEPKVITNLQYINERLDELLRY